MRNFLKIAIVAAASLAPIAVLSVPSLATTSQGAYSLDQATDGARLYAGQCAMCHGKALEGTLEIPALTGGRFLGNWSHGPVGALTDYIHRAMPQMAPGTLTPENSAKIVAYLLQQNGIPAGKAPLSSDPDSLRKILIEPAKP